MIYSLLIYERKLDDSFPVDELYIDFYHGLFRFDQNGNYGGILPYIHEDIIAKVIHCDFPVAEIPYVEINLQKKKLLINN